MSTQDTQNVNLYMRPDLWRQVGIIAAYKNTTKRAILEEALRDYLSKERHKLHLEPIEDDGYA